MRRRLPQQNVGYRTLPGPDASFHEQVWQHELAADGDGRVPVAVVNERFDHGRGLGFLVVSRKAEFPAACSSGRISRRANMRWASSRRPTTCSASRSRKERGELIWLEHGHEKSYTTRFAVLADADEIAGL